MGASCSTDQDDLQKSPGASPQLSATEVPGPVPAPGPVPEPRDSKKAIGFVRDSTKKAVGFVAKIDDVDDDIPVRSMTTSHDDVFLVSTRPDAQLPASNAPLVSRRRNTWRHGIEKVRSTSVRCVS